MFLSFGLPNGRLAWGVQTEWVDVLRLAGSMLPFEQTHFGLRRHEIQLGTKETDLHELSCLHPDWRTPLKSKQ